MADIKPIPTSGFNTSSMNGVLNLILAAFQIPETPAEPLPPPLVMVGAKLRPGLSPQSVASDIISKQSDAGRVVGNVFADGPNVEEAMELIRTQEVINAILTKAKIEVVIPPGIAVTAAGGNAGGPVVCQGVTTSMAIGDGIIR